MAGKERVAFLTLGCKANQYDSMALMAGLSPDRYEVVESEGAPVEADVYVINTCTVTGRSDFQSRQMVRRARKWNPQARILVTGCLAEAQPGTLKNLPLDALIGVKDRERALEWIKAGVSGERRDRAPRTGSASANRMDNHFFFHPEGGRQRRTRALVKVQDGCDLACAFCIVPRARGRSRSLPEPMVISQLRSLKQQGFQEAVLTGIHLGFYGRDQGKSLVALLRRIEIEPGLPARIRLSSLEPQEVSPELIEVIKGSSRICRHLHLPLQSGDEEILRRMRRLYSPAQFHQVASALSAALPDLCLGLDVIAGFPGETEAHFRSTLSFLEDIPWSYLHVFPFSRRPGTPASSMTGQIEARTIRSRAARLRELSERRRKAFYALAQGRRLRMLVEDEKAGWQRGFSDHYLPLRFQSDKDWQGQLVEIQVQGVDRQGGWGELA